MKIKGRKIISKKPSPDSEMDYRRVIAKIKPVQALPFELKVVVYGRAGAGKTTFASTFPKPILLIDASEQGTDSILDVKGVDVLRLANWDDINDAYWYVVKSKKYKTVVIDTISNVQDFAIKHVLAENNKSDEEVGGWGTMSRKDWGKVSTLMKTEMLNFRDIPGVNIVFIAHDRIFGGGEESEDNADGAITPEVGPRLMPSVASTLNAAVGVIGNMFVREHVREIKIGKKTKIKRSVQYCLRVGPHAYYTTKLRKPKSIAAPAFIVDPTYDKVVDVMSGKSEEK